MAGTDLRYAATRQKQHRAFVRAMSRSVPPAYRCYAMSGTDLGDVRHHPSIAPRLRSYAMSGTDLCDVQY
eukprot:2389049-Rhodomonas_salina.2